MSRPESLPRDPPPPPTPQDYDAAVRLPDYYADLPQAWFCSIDATFAASRVRKSLTKFNWVLSKLPFSLIDSIGLLCKNPASYVDLYKELQDILLCSYGLSASQRMSKWLDHPGCGNNRPSVMWDRLTALQPATVKKIQTVLFLCKSPRYIRDLINPQEFQEPETLI
jgi:hypothetical protein